MIKSLTSRFLKPKHLQQKEENTEHQRFSSAPSCGAGRALCAVRFQLRGKLSECVGCKIMASHMVKSRLVVL